MQAKAVLISTNCLLEGSEANVYGGVVLEGVDDGRQVGVAVVVGVDYAGTDHVDGVDGLSGRHREGLVDGEEGDVDIAD